MIKLIYSCSNSSLFWGLVNLIYYLTFLIAILFLVIKVYAVYMHGLKDCVRKGTGEIIVLWDIDFINKKILEEDNDEFKNLGIVLE